MSNNSSNPPKRKKQSKRSPLPKTAKIQKRPLLHPAVPSPYTSAASSKIIYLSARTPFMSAIKRCEKLLQLSNRRLVQAATVVAKNNARWGRRGREDEVSGIAAEAERMRRKGEGGEEVCFKASGKAIGKGLSVGAWFGERGEMYGVRLETGSVGVVDGVEYEEEDVEEEMDVDGKKDVDVEEKDRPEARIRQISVLMVYVSLK